MGIEPTHQPWEGRRLPLHHTRAPRRASGSSSPASRPTNLAVWPVRCGRPHARSGPRGPALPPREVRAVTWIYAISPWLLFVSVIVAAAARFGSRTPPGSAPDPAERRNLAQRRRGADHRNDRHHPCGHPFVSVGDGVAGIRRRRRHRRARGQRRRRFVSSRRISSRIRVAESAVGAECNTSTRSIDQEWPAMRYGRESPLARSTAFRALTIVARYQPRNSAEQALQQTALGSRRRLSTRAATGSSPTSRASRSSFGSATSSWRRSRSVSRFIFRVRKEGAHLIMTLALTTVICDDLRPDRAFRLSVSRRYRRSRHRFSFKLRHSLAGEPIESGLPIAPARSQSSSTR